jgi:hypothetical protein
MRLRAFFAGAMLVVPCAMACGDADPSDGEGDDAGSARDVRVEIPEEDANHYNFVGGEEIIAPGEERTTCFHMTVPRDMAVGNIDMLQGDFGHHAVIVSSNEPLPDGTVEDCTDQTTYAKYKALLIPVNEPPPGHAYWLTKGTPVVLQSHYVNASDEPILVRDVVRARVVPEEEVTTWMAPFTATALYFEIPATNDVSEVTFDCNFDRDVDLLYVGGHMHEWGSSFDLELGPNADDLASIYTVEGWVPDFRDLPPIEIYENNPLRITQGSVLRTTCRWINDTGKPLMFPQEMCVSFGVLAGSKEAYDCRFTN